MQQYSYPLLTKWLGSAILRLHEGTPMPRQSGAIRLLDETDLTLQSDVLYIGTPAQLQRLLHQGSLPAEGVEVLTVAGPPVSDIPPQLTLLETSLELVPLYNRVQAVMQRFRSWDERLHQVVYANGGLQEMLEIAAEEIHGTIQLLNPGYKHLAAVYLPSIHDPMVDEVQENGYLSYETIQRIHSETPLRQGPRYGWSEFRSSESGNYVITHPIRHGKTIVARLSVVLSGPLASLYDSSLCEILAAYVTEYMCSSQGVDHISHDELGSLVADLIECRLTDPAELEQRTKQLRLAITRYYHILLVRLEGQSDRDTIPWNFIISQLERIFPFSNITTYRGDIFILARKTNRGSRFALDQKRLLPLLEQFNGYMSVSNSSEFLTSLPPLYYQIRDAMRLGRVMSPDQRILYYEDYSMYQIVEMAAEAAQHRLNSRNLAHLCNNALISLLLYDKKNGTNLVEVLHTYLLNERNATETAKLLYLHRNTMLYKIRKIEEVLGESLDDPILRQRLLFSYQVLTYMQLYRKENVLELKRAPKPKAEASAGDADV